MVLGTQRGYLQEKCHVLQFLQRPVWLVLQPLHPTPGPQETEEEKQFRALFEQISGKVSSKRFGLEQDAKRGESLLLLSRATWNKSDVFWEHAWLQCVVWAPDVTMPCGWMHKGAVPGEQAGGPKLELKLWRSLPGLMFSCSWVSFESAAPAWGLLQTDLCTAALLYFPSP